MTLRDDYKKNLKKIIDDEKFSPDNSWKIKIRKTIETIRKMPNRDDKLYGKNGVAIGLLDGGGISKFEVIKLLEDLIK